MIQVKRKSKKNVLNSLKGFFSFFVCGLFIIVLYGCASLTQQILKDPKVNIENVMISNVNLEEISLILGLKVENPNPIPISIHQVNYLFKLSGETVTEGKTTEGIDIPAQGFNTVNVPFKFKYSNLGNLFSQIFQKNAVKTYEVIGDVDIGIIKIPFNKKGEIELNDTRIYKSK